MVTNHFGITGISTVILNYCKELDRHKYDLTVIAGKPIAEENRKECAENGICLIELPSRHQESVKHYVRLWKVLKQNHYDIVHVQMYLLCIAVHFLLQFQHSKNCVEFYLKSTPIWRRKS